MSREITIITDSGCDISHELLEKWQVKCIELTFSSTESDTTYTNNDIPVDEFYMRMREGESFKTSSASPDCYSSVFGRELENGNDVLYISLSSGLSGTVNAARIAANELSESYPEGRVEVIDSLCASAGQGMLVKLAADKRESGASLDESADYIRGILPKICHWFTVDDLKYLRKGGRIGGTAAIAATLLGIKPILHMSTEGCLEGVHVVRGRRKAISSLADKFANTAIDSSSEYFISHGDCIEDALELEQRLEKQFGHKASLITEIGPVIGSHSGPGTLAVYFLSGKR